VHSFHAKIPHSLSANIRKMTFFLAGYLTSEKNTFLFLSLFLCLGRRDGFCFCLSPLTLTPAPSSFTDGLSSFGSSVPIPLTCYFEALDALAIEIAFSSVNLSSINSRSFTDRFRVLKTNLSLTMSSTAEYSRDFTLFFNRATNLSTILVFLHYLLKLMSLKDHVLPRVAVPLKLLNGLIHLLLIAFRKLKCGENRKN